MIIDNKTYSDNKLYSGIVFSDGYPLMSKYIHERENTSTMKNYYLMNNLLGCGTVNRPQLLTTPTSIDLVEPAVLLVNGDIILVGTDEEHTLVTVDDITLGEQGNHTVCIVLWEQYLTEKSVLKAYGGIRNKTLDNDLWNTTLNIRGPARVQYRWMPVIVPTSQIEEGTFNYQLPLVDEDGNYSNTKIQCTFVKSDQGDFTTDCPAEMDFSESDILRLVPIINLTYDSNITSSNPVNPVTVGGGFIDSTEEPVGNYPEGAVWWNAGRIKFYIEGVGWVAPVNDVALIRYSSSFYLTETIITPRDVTIPIGIENLSENDILEVYYEGVYLKVDINYSIDYDNKNIKLLNFTTKEGDLVTINAYRAVNASDPESIANTLSNHMSSTGNKNSQGHVKLTDIISESDSTLGTAATPKLVKDAIENLSEEVDQSLSTKYSPENKPSPSDLNIYSKEEVNTQINSVISELPAHLIKKDIKIQPSDYISDSTYADYPYKSIIDMVGVTSDMVPTITYSVADILSGIHCPVATTEEGSVIVYASEIPSNPVIIESLLVQGRAEGRISDKYIDTVLSAHSTSTTVLDNDLHVSSIIDLYTDSATFRYNDMQLEEGSLTILYDELESVLNAKVVVRNV